VQETTTALTHLVIGSASRVDDSSLDDSAPRISTPFQSNQQPIHGYSDEYSNEYSDEHSDEYSDEYSNALANTCRSDTRVQ
jgi:hypothetical protein